MIGTRVTQLKVGLASLTRLSLLFAAWALSACGPAPEEVQNQALAAAAKWLTQAAQSVNQSAAPPACHAFGLVSFPEVGCQDMIDHAGRLLPDTREIDRVSLPKCFGQGAKEVCGEFAEIWFRARDSKGASVTEGMVLKRDDGRFRMYWYRSDTLLAELSRREAAEDAESDAVQLAQQQQRLQAIYTQMVERDPSIYRFPPCIDAQVRSSVMLGDLLPPSQVSGSELENRALKCSAQVCLALVGRKVAPLCL